MCPHGNIGLATSVSEALQLFLGITTGKPRAPVERPGIFRTESRKRHTSEFCILLKKGTGSKHKSIVKPVTE